ncbi:transposase [Sphingobium sp. HBC34]|uniref:Transposase n=1 Tax=Sphingobium cyanobacteriorum TaxID=3063954 RepID=A0ABT8ZLN6_9SPHN|nr:transposase [Sphingobium sp. HBC34]MDO7835454.1 transposase [Sphingobium sp. HBC34]
MSQITEISGPERRRVWTDQQKRELVAAVSAAGANVAEIARRADSGDAAATSARSSGMMVSACRFMPRLSCACRRASRSQEVYLAFGRPRRDCHLPLADGLHVGGDRLA